MDTREYVKNARASREEHARAMLAALEAGGEFEGQDASDAIDELPLSVELVRRVVITLSVGGPHEEIDATMTDEGEIASATFVAQWGTDREETPLHEGDALWTLAEHYAEVFEHGPQCPEGALNRIAEAMTEDSGPWPRAASHDCGVCDGILRPAEQAEWWTCSACGSAHTSRDCCEFRFEQIAAILRETGRL